MCIYIHFSHTKKKEVRQKNPEDKRIEPSTFNDMKGDRRISYSGKKKV